MGVCGEQDRRFRARQPRKQRIRRESVTEGEKGGVKDIHCS